MNQSELAVKVTKLEGGKKNLSIAQVKEVLRCFGDVYYGLNETGASKLMKSIYDAAAKRAKKK